MLDWGHRLVLRSVDKGREPRPSPALENLVAAGLVEETAEGHTVTPAGRVALDASKSTKLERIGWPVVWLSVFVVAVASVIELLS